MVLEVLVCDELGQQQKVDVDDVALLFFDTFLAAVCPSQQHDCFQCELYRNSFPLFVHSNASCKSLLGNTHRNEKRTLLEFTLSLILIWIS